jgi:hypothetical protein
MDSCHLLRGSHDPDPPDPYCSGSRARVLLPDGDMGREKQATSAC